MHTFRLAGVVLIALAVAALAVSGAFCVAAPPAMAAAPGTLGAGAEANQAAHHSPVVPVLVLLLVVILAAKLGGALLEWLGQPSVLGELLAGILLGNLVLLGFGGVERLFAVPVFGELPAERMIELLGELGVLLLLFEVGLESNLKEMASVGLSSLLVAVLGVVAPFFLGWAVGAWLLPDSSVYVHVFLGATLCATSVGITARVLKDLEKIHLRESKIVLGAAVIDDILGLIVLAVVAALIQAAGSGAGGISAPGTAWIVAKALLFLAGAVAFGRWIAPPVFAVAGKLRGRHLLLCTGLMILFLFSVVASKIGLAAIIGAFAAGLILDETQVRELREREEHGLEELIAPLAAFLVPVFFVYMGYRVDLAHFANGTILTLAAALTVAAIAGKQLCSLGVVEKGLDRLSVGIGMVPRGEVGLIFAGIGMGLMIDGRAIIDAGTFSAVVIMVILTTLITPPALKWSLSRPRGYEGASDEEMARIAAERRQRRKDYYRSQAKDDRRRGRGGERGERGGEGRERGGEGRERGQRTRGGEGGSPGRGGSRRGGERTGERPGERSGERAAERGRRERGEAPAGTVDRGHDRGEAAAGGGRRRRPRRRRSGGRESAPDGSRSRKPELPEPFSLTHAAREEAFSEST